MMKRNFTLLILLLMMTTVTILPGCSPAPENVRTIRLYNEEQGRIEILPLEDYVAGCVAAEMPASYAPAALQCQAIAARTYAARKSQQYAGSGCVTHPGANVCSDSTCCQGYLPQEKWPEKWGNSHDAMGQRVMQAAKATSGVILTWEGQPCEMLYHACSGGQTADAAEVFARDVPYLVSVSSPGEEHYSGFSVTQTFSRNDVAKQLVNAFPGCGVKADTLSSDLRRLSSTASGRVKEMLVGDKTVSGTEFRKALGLRSSAFTWTFTADEISFHTTGYGHGVGMSQAGAQAMASNGASWQEILSHYYPGTTPITLPQKEESGG